MAENEPKIPDTSPPTPPPGPLEYGEYRNFATGNWRTLHEKWRSLRDLWLSYVLFAFVLGINIGWECWIVHWIRLSGWTNTGFHLSDGVIVALATTSVANFIGLVAIVAKHLFPEIKQDKESPR